MKKALLSIIVVFASVLMANAQTWVGYTTTTVNLRQGPGTYYDVVEKLQPKTLLYIDSEESTDGFYFAVDIENDIEGYVSKSYVKYYQEVAKSKGTSIETTGTTHSYNASITVSNKTSTYMTLRVNKTSYKFSPYEQKEITVTPGKFTYRASSPGVIPASGSYTADSYSAYTWEFWISNSR